MTHTNVDLSVDYKDNNCQHVILVIGQVIEYIFRNILKRKLHLS